MLNIIPRFAAIITAALLSVSNVTAAGLPFVTKKKEHYQVSDSEAVTIMRESQVLAVTSRPAVLLKEMDGQPELHTVARLMPGQAVEILRDHQTEWYFVRDIILDREGWLRREDLVIPPDESANKDLLNPAELEAYVNAMGYDSSQPYLSLVDVDRQRLYVFKGSRYKWKLNKDLLCCTGKNESPTVTGQYSLTDRGIWFYSERLKSGAKYWVRFDGPYLVHSLPMDRDGNVQDYTLGAKGSSGCIRLSVSDAEWFYETVPDGSAIIIL